MFAFSYVYRFPHIMLHTFSTIVAMCTNNIHACAQSVATSELKWRKAQTRLYRHRHEDLAVET